MPEGRLVVCATPIGNLGDISQRLREALQEADVVYSEDTRRTRKLLNHLGIEVRARSLFAGNEQARTEELVADVSAGKSVVLVSDAGMPTISDPGSHAVRRVRESGHPVSVIPGPSAVTAALAISGVGGNRFVFEGFLPRKASERKDRLQGIAADERTVVVFASPKRLGADLADLSAVHTGPRLVVVVRELTKIHEEVWSGTLEDAAEFWLDREVKGEITVVLAPTHPGEVDLTEAVHRARRLIESGESPSSAARMVSGETGVSRRRIYQTLLDQERS